MMMQISQGIARNKSLRSLDISNTSNETFVMSELFQSLAKNRSIQELNLFNSSIQSTQTMSDFIKMLLNPDSHIAALNISSCDIRPDCLLTLLNQFYKSPSLQRLSLGFLGLGKPELRLLGRSLSKVSAGRPLDLLDLKYNNLTLERLGVLMGAFSDSVAAHVHRLNLCGNEMGRGDS